MFSTIVIGLALAAAVPQTISIPTNGPGGFEIAGVQLATTPDAARQALAKAGYRVGTVSQLESFDGQVAARIAELRHQWRNAKYDATSEIHAIGPANERLTVDFAQWPDGPHVVVVSFMGSPERQPQDAFKTLVEAKFGKPTMHVIGGWRWCSAGEKQCGPVANPALPTLDADYQSRVLTLKVGGDATQARKDLVEAEARKVVPLQNGSAF